MQHRHGTPLKDGLQSDDARAFVLGVSGGVDIWLSA